MLAETTADLVVVVENGTYDAAIVYATDMTESGDADIVEIPPDLNVLVEYSTAVVSTSANAATAQAFIDFVAGPAGQQVLQQYNLDHRDQAASSPSGSGGLDLGAVGSLDVPAPVGVAPGAVAAGLEPVVAGAQRAGVAQVGWTSGGPWFGVVDLAVAVPAAGPQTSPVEVQGGLQAGRFAC